jgi:hypothetical protein
MKRLPDALLRPELDPIRDLLVDALAGLLQLYEARSDHAVAQSDITRSVEQYLTALARDRDAGRAQGEADGALRARTLDRSCVTETAIAAAVNAILALVTDEPCALVDSALDRWFIHDGTDGNGGPPKWHSFVGGPPNYPDRYFADDSANTGGVTRPFSAVGGARLFAGTLGRLLLLRVPDLGYQLLDAALVFDGTVVPEFGFFVGDGAAPPGGGFIDVSSAEPVAIYGAIANLMETALGQSVRWEMISDLVA